MDPEDADQAPEARPPLLEDLVSLCRALNDEGARYVVIGGMAMIQAGFGRATNDIDLLIDTSPENQDRVRKALMALPDQAVRDMTPDDLETRNDLGIALARLGRFDEAAACFRDVLRRNPDHPKAGRNLELTLDLQGKAAPSP